MNYENFQLKNIKSLFVALFFIVSLSIVMPHSFAINQGKNKPETITNKQGGNLSQSLCNVVNALQGTLGKAIATIAVIVLGVGLFLGKLSWPLAIATAIGIGLIFGASTIVQWISGSSSTGFC